MRHKNSGRKFDRNTSSRRAMLRNLTANLILHERIETTDAKAKELRRVAERLITKARRLGLVAYTPQSELSPVDRARRLAASRNIAAYIPRFGVRVETGSRRVEVDGVEVALSNKEFELLRVMMSRAGQVVTREEILSEVWNDPSMKTSKTLDMHMSWLRRKLAGQEPGSGGSAHLAEQRISTVRGVGFRFETD